MEAYLQKSSLDSRELAVGGLCLVEEVELRDGRKVAQKSLLPKYQGKAFYEALIRREFEILTELDHPLIVKAYSLELKPGLSGYETACLVMEHIEGLSLSSLFKGQLKQGKAKALATYQSIKHQLVEILNVLQSARIIHGDLCPDNLMMHPDGHLRLIDFGVARKTANSKPAPFLIAGHDGFRAPEHRADGASSKEGDVYAVGQILEFVSEALGGVADADRDTMKFSRQLPSLVQGFSPVSLEPFTQSVRPTSALRAPTKVIPQPRLAAFSQKLLLLGASLLFLTSIQPVSVVSINTLPVSEFQVGDSMFFETPRSRLLLPSGTYPLRFRVQGDPLQSYFRSLRVESASGLKFFEDFRNADSLEE